MVELKAIIFLLVYRSKFIIDQAKLIFITLFENYIHIILLFTRMIVIFYSRILVS